MSLVDLVRNGTQLPLVTEDGDPSPLKLAPGLTDAEIDALAATLPCPLPADVRELLQLCSGFSDSPCHGPSAAYGGAVLRRHVA